MNREIFGWDYPPGVSGNEPRIAGYPEEEEMEHEELAPWMTTFSGNQVWPWDPTPETIDILDIAVALSRVPRFAGHTKYFYSVAQHCTIGSHLIDEPFALEFLLHDAAEAYIGDLVGPIKQHLKKIHVAEEALMTCIRKKFGLPLVQSSAVTEMDRFLLVQEAHQLIHTNHEDWHLRFGEVDENVVINPVEHNAAYRDFMERFVHLKGEL